MDAYARLRKLDDRYRHLQQQVDTARRCGHFCPEFFAMQREMEALGKESAQLKETLRQTIVGAARLGLMHKPAVSAIRGNVDYGDDDGDGGGS